MTAIVTTAAELAHAIEQQDKVIEVSGTITGSPSVTLPKGTTIRGIGDDATLAFLAKGLRLSADNTVENLTVTTTDYEVAIYNDTSIANAGTLRLVNVRTIGQIYLVAEDELDTVRVEVDGVHVQQADVRGRVEQPHGYNVDVLQGGLTLWNRQKDAASSFSATLKGVRVGTPATPVRGSGVFLAGHADREGHLTGGALVADLVETLEVETDGGIAPGTPDRITGGVFVVSGAQVERVVNKGTVVTHGQNDMVLDNWGEVGTWTAQAEIRSTGPSGIGFVNFGSITTLDMQAPIVTTGKGSRGFNLYDGTLHEAFFDSIRTTGDDSIGIQVSKPMGTLSVKGDVETTGGEGLSLVRGVQVTLQAIALSVKSGGSIDTVTIGGALRTHGDDVTTVEVASGGHIGTLSTPVIEAHGAVSHATLIEGTIDSRK